jgi:DNA-3-methyladenine glycosylase
MILQRAFYERDVITVSKDLLGKLLVNESLEGKTSGKIVEIEAYCGPEDRAAHSFGGRRTARNEVMFGPKGHAYVYFIYGMYYCFNVTAGNVAGKPEAALIRALESLEGKDIMSNRRGATHEKAVTLTNGPGKLCMAMGISKVQNCADLIMPPFYIMDAPTVLPENIVETERIGIDYAREWRNKPWRFYIKGNASISAK